eukprot:Gb_03488 [translate_table: standard]
MRQHRVEMAALFVRAALNKGNNFILHSSDLKMVDICRAITQDQSYHIFAHDPSQRRQYIHVHRCQKDHRDSMRNSLCNNYRYFLYSFSPMCISILLPFERNISCGSDIFISEGQRCSDIETEPSIGLGFADEEIENPEAEGQCDDDAKDYNVPNDFRRICKLLKMAEENMENKLTAMSAKLSPELVRDVLTHSSDHADSALRFFTWAKNQPGYSHSSAVYNEMVNIAGSNRAFQAMGSLIEEMTTKGHSLTGRAFSFVVSNPSMRTTVKELLRTLGKMEDPGRKSAFQGLLSALSKENCLEVAMEVLQEMTHKGQFPTVSYYNDLIAAKCRNGQLFEAKDLLNEMIKSGCQPNTNSYNYLLGTLCKRGKITDACQLLEAMEKSGHPPDPITYEILIFSACKTGKIDGALDFLNKMLTDGLRPRYSTYSAFIKGYFYARQYEKAYNFVVETSKQDRSADSMNYTLLVSLFEKSGKILEARGLLLEMIEKGLSPKFSLCRKVTRNLIQAGKRDMAQELENKLTKVTNTSNPRP